MGQILDASNLALPNSWRHRNPVYAGWITGIGALLAGLLIFVALTLFTRALSVGDEANTNTGLTFYSFVPILSMLFFLLIIFMPGIYAMRLYKQANEVAQYKTQFRIAFRASFLPNSLVIVLMSLLNGTITFYDTPTTIGNFFGVFIVAAILSAFTNSIIALFFRKRATSSFE